MSAASYSLTGSVYKTNWPLLLLIFIMPLRNIQLQYIPNLGGGLNALNILFLLSLMHAFLYGKKPEVKPAINGVLVWYIISSLIALGFGYAFLSGNTHGLWKDMKDMLIPVFLVFVVQRSITDDIQWRRVLLAMLLPLPYCFKVVWSQYLAVSSWHYSDDLRISGTFMDFGANEMGAFSLMMCLICLGCTLTTWPEKKWRYFFLAMFAFSGMCLVYSYSRGGYLAFLLGLIMMIGAYKHKRKLVAPILITLTLFSFNMPESVKERFSTISASDEERDESADSRFVFWAIAFEKFLERPVQGYGYHTAQDKRINPHEMDTHNYYVKMLVERGLIGFITFLLILRAFKRLISGKLKSENYDPIKYGVVLGMYGAWFALVLGNMFGDRFSHYPISTNLWITIALISILPSENKKIEDWSSSSENNVDEFNKRGIVN